MKRRSSATRAGSTTHQREADEFLALFTEVERFLKKKLGRRADDRTAVSTMITAYAERNPYWSDQANRLRLLKDIRNLLVHNRDEYGNYPVDLPPHTLQRMKEIHDHLKEPVRIRQRYCRPVVSVTPDTTLRSMVVLAYEKQFSQFPVLSQGRFAGLITENAVVRWLGRHSVSAPDVDLDDVRVNRVMKEQESEYKRCIFAFARLDDPEDEVMSRFVTSRLLEVVLLTEDGRSTSALAGIITQWDAARYTL